MTYRTTNKERIANYDALKAERDVLSLTVYDLVNGKFSEPVKVYLKEYDKTETGHIKVSVSMRGMPIFLVHCSDSYTAAYTEDQMETLSSRWTTYGKALAAAFAKLKHRHYPKVA